MEMKLLLVAALLVGGAVFFTQADQSFSSFLQPSDCTWNVLEIDNRTFSSVDEFRQGVEERGGNFQKFKENLDFRVRNGELQYKFVNGECGERIG